MSSCIKFENSTGYTPEDYPLPTRNTIGSAGYDFCLPNCYAPIDIKPKHKFLLFTGVKFKCPRDYYLKLVIRSSIGIKHSLRLMNIEGIIDSDYYSNPKNDGNIGICLYNFGDTTVRISTGQKIVQGIIQRYYTTDEEPDLGIREGSSLLDY